MASNPYELARYAGDVWVSRLDDDDNPTGEYDLGLCTIITMGAPSTEDYTVSGRQIANYGTVVYSEAGELEQKISITTQTDNLQNMLIMMFGESAVYSQTAGDNTATPETITGYLDKWTKLSNRNLDTENPPVITDSTATTTYIEDTDYEVDYIVGRIKPLSTGSITDEEELKAGATWLLEAGNIIEANRQMSGNFFIRALVQNKIDNKFREVEVDKVQLKPSGDMPLITEPGEFVELSMEGTIITKDGKQWREILID